MRSWQRAVRSLASAPAPSERLDHIHIFVPSMQADGSLTLRAALSILSASIRHPDARIVLHVHRLPQGFWWELVASRVVPCMLPVTANAAPADHGISPPHLCRLKLLALREVGGLACDGDFLILANMDELATHPFTISAQATLPGAPASFNSAIMAGRPGNDFATAWLKSEAESGQFSGSLNEEWFCSRLPLKIYAQAPSRANILPHVRLSFPIWIRMADYLLDDRRAPEYLELARQQYALCLRPWRDSDLEDAPLTALLRSNSLLSHLCRELLAKLPERDRQRIADQFALSLDDLIPPGDASNQRGGPLLQQID